MIEPYRMVVINIAALSIICLGILFYRFIYPKRPIGYFPLLLIFSLLPIISILRKGVYESGDFNMHIYRAMVFYDNLKEGNLMPSWGGDLNATYGYPVFIFNYILHYYLISFFHFLGFSFVAGMKIFLILSLFGSGITMYLWTKKIFHNNLARFTAAIFYVFAPYHLITLHFRVNGENFAYALTPLLFYQLHNLIEKQNLRNILLFGLLVGLLFFAHSANAAFTSIFLVMYCGLLYVTKVIRSPMTFLTICLGFMVGALLASPVFYAHLVLSQVTYGYVLAGNPSFTPFWQLIFSPWRFGLLLQGPRGEFAFIIGYTQILALVLVSYALLKKKIALKIRVPIIFWILAFLFLSFLITPQSSLFWKIIPVLSMAQFSYRLLFFVNIASAILAGYLILMIPKRKTVIYALIFATIGYTIINWGNRRTIPEIADDTLRKNIPQSTRNYEGMAVMASPRWLDLNDLWEKKVPEKHLDVLSGRGAVREVKRQQEYHAYIVSADNNLTLRENTLYFPGWSIMVDTLSTPIQYTQNNSLGKMVFLVPKGLHLVEAVYKDSPYYFATKAVSLLGFFSIILFFAIREVTHILKYAKKSLQ